MEGSQIAPNGSYTTFRPSLRTVASNTIRIARLKLIFIAAKVVKDQNRDKVKYSIHDARTPAMINFLDFLVRWTPSFGRFFDGAKL